MAYAGDEFVIVLPTLSKAQAMVTAGEVQAQIRAHTFLTDVELTVRMTASLGVATYPEDAADMSLLYYAPRDIGSRLIYLADPGKALSRLGHNSVEKGALALLKPWFHLPIEEYDPFLASGQEFFVFGDSGHFLNWLLPDLIASCRQLELSGQNDASLLFLVNPGNGC